jgi:hypothetical protein
VQHPLCSVTIAFAANTGRAVGDSSALAGEPGATGLPRLPSRALAANPSNDERRSQKARLSLPLLLAKFETEHRDKLAGSYGANWKLRPEAAVHFGNRR